MGRLENRKYADSLTREQMVKLLPPMGILLDKMVEIDGAPIRKTGRVVYVNYAHLYYVVEFKGKLGNYKQGYKAEGGPKIWN